MKYLITLLCGVFVAATRIYACDVCGCSASSQYLGLLPRTDLNFIGLQYQHSSFNSDHPSLFENRPDERSQDSYNTIQLWGRYAINKRLQLFAFVPYRSNAQKGDSVTYNNSGIGDISVLLNVLLIKDKGNNAKWRHQLLAGGGIKAPTGSYTGITTMDKLGLPNMQPGTGSWDFIVNTNYTLKHKNSGFNLDASYSITTPNSDSYKYGNKLNAGALWFYSLMPGDFTLLPQIGCRYEYSLHDYDNYAQRWLNEQSGGYMSFATLGLQSYYKKIGARLTWQLPLTQNYGSGYVTAGQRIDMNLFLLF